MGSTVSYQSDYWFCVFIASIITFATDRHSVYGSVVQAFSNTLFRATWAVKEVIIKVSSCVR